MMTHDRPHLTRQVVAVIERRGFRLTRKSGSHSVYKDEAGRRITLPVHGTKVLHPKVLASILRDAEITWEELQKLL